MSKKKSFYSGITEVLTTDGFKKISVLNGNEKLIILDESNELSVVSSYSVVKDKLFITNFGNNRRSVHTTKETVNDIFYSVDYDFSYSLDSNVLLNFNDRDYKITLSQYLLIGYVLFNLFNYDREKQEFIFKPPIKDMNKLIILVDKTFEDTYIDIVDNIVEYFESGVMFTIKSNSFPNGVITYINVILDCLLKHKNILEPFFNSEVIYEYLGSKTKETMKYVNIKNKELEKIFCLLCNMYYGTGVVSRKTIGWDLLFINTVVCYKGEERTVQTFAKDSGIKECYGIKINSDKVYYMPSVVGNGLVVNFNFIPTYKESE